MMYKNNNMNVIHGIRRFNKPISLLTALIFLSEIFIPTSLFALTGGPSQPEVQSFEPAGTSEMVDLFTGDFNYNIPLLDVEGYPVNLAYHAGITMDQEASWVGLGWNINPGVINRNMRGLPDDFNGDVVNKEFNLKPNQTLGVNLGADFELFGLKVPKLGLGLNMGVFMNNYRGVGYEFGVAPSISAGSKSKASLTIGLGFNSQTGLSVDPSMNFSMKQTGADKNSITGGFNIGSGYNSRTGMKSLNMGISASASQEKGTNKNGDTKMASTSASMQGSPINFGTQTWTPNISMPMNTLSVSAAFTIGGALWGAHASARGTGYYSRQAIKSSSVSKAAYGYLYEQNKPGKDVLLDFNREQDKPYLESSTNLPLANHTHDLYAISGQGVGGSYRLYRSDVALLHDDYQQSNSSGFSVGIELGIGTYAHLGGEVQTNFDKSSSGLWESGNSFRGGFNFSKTGNTADYEPAYFRNSQEVSPSDDVFVSKFGGKKAIRPDVAMMGIANKSYSYRDFGNGHSSQAISGSVAQNTRSARKVRNNVMSYLTAAEASVFGLETDIKNYTTNGSLNNTTISRSGGYRSANHISEINVINPGGSRYVYGIPAYNTSQIEKTFNVSGTGDCHTGQVAYNSSEDVPSNTQGDDWFYSSTTTPAYAHSYLLTGVLSPDYVDLTGDGITDDDLGTAVKLNYRQVYQNYKWRVPYEQNEASFAEGLKSDAADDKGSYIYGTKEMWHTHSIESKNQIAFFYISNREDGMGVLGEDGGQNTSQKSYKLDSIVLYSKQDYFLSLSTPEHEAIPIKTVHFEYDYSLCQGVHNNSGTDVYTRHKYEIPPIQINGSNGGKLTLKKVYFTYGKSEKGFYSPYEFDYSSINPDYNLKDNDRWGVFKEELSTSCSPTSTDVPNPEYPYTSQNQTTADNNAEAWSLVEITLPSGGTINVEYESDDYAFVQNRRAMQMFKILGFSAHWVIPHSNQLYGSGLENDYMIVELTDPASSPSDFNDKYLKGIEDLQFTVLAHITDVDGVAKYEYVRGYVEIESYGLINSTTAYIQLKKVKIGDSNNNQLVQPISRAIWNFARIYTPKLTNPESYNSINGSGTMSGGAILKSLKDLGVGFSRDVSRMLNGYNKTMKNDGYGQDVILNKSFVRLNNPVKRKLGGGHRVKQISMNDGWIPPGTLSNSVYGQKYDYTMLDNTQWNTPQISSGVAAYEPSIGNEENPFHQPLIVEKSNKLAPNELYMTDQPYGESYFPAPTVGYSQVKVSSIHPTITETGAGYTISEFYTAKDFPISVKQTGVDQKRLSPEPFWSLFKVNNKDMMTVSQGYTIELNDMHGKPKKQSSYNENGAFISGSETIYYTDPLDGTQLYNSISTIDNTGLVSLTEMGVDYDVFTDMREQKSSAWSAGISGQLETLMLPFIIPIPLPIPCIFPSFKMEKTQFNSAVTTKVVFRHGIVKESIAYQEGASVKTENMLYDKATGEVLLTNVENEFNDKYYNYTIPAHWAYEEGMGQAYKNIGFSMAGVTASGSGISANAEPYLVPGDECMLNGSIKAYVYSGQGGTLYLIDESGSALNGTYDLKVIRSGRRNMQNTPVGSVLTLENPVVGNGVVIDHSKKVLNASATQFKDDWGTFANVLEDPASGDCGRDFTGDLVNPYVIGLKGNWRPSKTYSYLDDREYSTLLASGTDPQIDGTFASFSPFWTSAGSSIIPDPYLSSSKWVWSTEITKYSPYGQELENMDALGRFTSELYGYNHTLTTAAAFNAEYNQIAYDGFEDYNFQQANAICERDHWNFSESISNNASASIDNSKAHTGLQSAKLLAGTSVNVKRSTVPLTSGGTSNNTHLLQPEDQLGKFAPGQGNYVISGWLRENIDRSLPSYNNARAEIRFYSGPSTYTTQTIYASGNIIERWQKFEESFTIPANTIEVRVILRSSSTATTWFDDVRIYPEQGNMKSFAYNPVTLKLMATLDENNFATFYEYDRLGQLTRIKKETYKGIATVEENRAAKFKNRLEN